LNTTDPVGFGTQMQIADQTVLHTRRYPSHILLPVIPK
jgi:predicted acyl esterase